MTGRPCKDLTGSVFGFLTVLTRCYPNNAQNEALWWCQCQCGKIVNTSGHMLRRKQKTSCGCRYKLPRGENAARGCELHYQRHAKQRGYQWQLTREEFRSITQQECYYCGRKPEQIYKGRRQTGDYTYNGIDRIDNSKGYMLENCVACCGQCNYAKRTLELKEFLELCNSIARKHPISG